MKSSTTILALLGSLSLGTTALAQPEPDPQPVSDPEPTLEPEPEGDAGASMEIEMEADTVESADSGWNLAIAPRVGLAVPTSKLSPFVSFGLELGYRLPALDHRLSVLLDVAYTKPSHDDSVNDARVGGDAGYEIDESEIKLGLGGNFRLWGGDETLVPWVGAAAIMQRLESTETNDLAPGENTAAETKFGGELSVGADYRLGPGYALGEARMVFTDLNDQITGNSNAGNVNLSLGYRLVF